MKVVILAGGLGSRITEESHLKPKPMIEIGEKPILWHIMKIYACQGFNDFVVCLGYKGYLIKEYFAHHVLHESDVTFDFRGGIEKIVHHRHAPEEWSVTLVNTGVDTMTGGRVKRVQPFVGDQAFMLTYGDGVADIDLAQLLAHHRRHGKAATITAVQPIGRFGALAIGEGGRVEGFREKPRGDNAWINGGFFVMEPAVFDRLAGDATVLEREPLEGLARDGELVAYEHRGFWQPMDTMRDKVLLDELWASGRAPWKVWG